MDEAFIGSIVLFAGNYAPSGWALCDGRTLQIIQNQALFAVIGNVYGGDGRTTFALPDLRGRVPAGVGQGINLSPITIGQQTGANTSTLTIAQMPAHSHSVSANATTGGRSVVQSPVGNFPAQNQDGSGNYAPTADGLMSPAMIGTSGGNQPVSVMQPTLGLNYIICLQGLFPPRD